VDPDAGFGADEPNREGYGGGPFVPHEIVTPSLPPESITYSAKSRDWFDFDGPPLNTYQFHFLRKTVELAREHGALLVILHMPSPTERGASVVRERQLIPDLFGDGVAFVGIPSTRMFANVPDAQVLDYFKDEHLNFNGMALYTKIITPALIQLYERYTQAR
jgi:hypothetical protein